jgi:hypothetical protein
MSQVLKLNKSYMPIEIISFQDAFRLIQKGTAEIIDVYEDRYFNTFKEAFNAPAVIRLLHFIAPKKDMKFYKPFTRRLVYERDEGKCCYCGKEVSLSKFTYDHIIAKSNGGLTNWQNIVTCCLKCNSKKSNKTLAEAGMKLLKKPYAPLIADSFNKAMIIRLKNIPKIYNNQKWRDYLYWDLPLNEDKISL